MLEVNVTVLCRDCEQMRGAETVRAARQSRSESFVVEGCLIDTGAVRVRVCVCVWWWWWWWGGGTLAQLRSSLSLL